MRAVIALGGNAMTGPDGSATAEAQEREIATALVNAVTGPGTGTAGTVVEQG